MEITEHIYWLLYLHDCFTIPGLGGFVLNNKPAEIDSSSGELLPPGKHIMFNRRLLHDDGLLISRIAQFENINYLDAKRRVADFVTNITFGIEHDSEFVLDNIGRFLHDNHGNICFQSNNEINFNSESFGFEKLYFPVLYKSVGSRELENRLKDRTNMKLRLTKKQITGIAIAVPIIIFSALIPYKLIRQKEVKQNYSSLNPIVSDTFSPKPVSSDTLSHKSINLDEAIDKSTNKRNALYYEEPEYRASHTYYLIGGSFKVYINAKEYQTQLIENGFTNAEIVKSHDQLYRVALGSYYDKHAALQELSRVREEEDDPSIWLLTK